MSTRKIYITAFDKRRLEELLTVADEFGHKQRKDLPALAGELARATVVPSNKIPADVITMNSKAQLRDMETDEEMTYTLSFPMNANAGEGSISVLAPIGTALLGYAAGDVIEWPVPDGIRRIKIERVIYQPEAAGDFHL